MGAFDRLFAPAQTWFASLSARERRLVGGCAAAVLGFIVFITVISFSNSARATERRTLENLDRLAQVQTLAASFRDAEAQRQQVEANLRRSDVKLISYLEEKGTAAGLDIPTMNPKGDVPIGDGKIIESAVELTLTDVPLGKLIEFLNAVEAGPGVVKVKYLRIEPRPANETLTAWTTIATYRMK
jgi:general secretion pathway protein M